MRGSRAKKIRNLVDGNPLTRDRRLYTQGDNGGIIRYDCGGQYRKMKKVWNKKYY